MGEAEGDQRDLGGEERQAEVVAGLHGEEEDAGQDGEAGAEGGDGAQEAQRRLEADVAAPEADEAQVHGDDGADEERHAEEVGGVDGGVGPARVLEERGEPARLDGGAELGQAHVRSG